MSIPLNTLNHPPKPPLELCTIKLYSTGFKGKVYTNRFYKSMNHNFGIEMTIRNNTSRIQDVKIGGCVYDDNGNAVVRWNNNKKLNAYSSITSDFFVRESSFTKMKEGTYKVQFWVNDKKVQKDFFTITYK